MRFFPYFTLYFIRMVLRLRVPSTCPTSVWCHSCKSQRNWRYFCTPLLCFLSVCFRWSCTWYMYIDHVGSITVQDSVHFNRLDRFWKRKPACRWKREVFLWKKLVTWWLLVSYLEWKKTISYHCSNKPEMSQGLTHWILTAQIFVEWASTDLPWQHELIVDN